MEANFRFIIEYVLMSEKDDMTKYRCLKTFKPSDYDYADYPDIMREEYTTVGITDYFKRPGMQEFIKNLPGDIIDFDDLVIINVELL